MKPTKHVGRRPGGRGAPTTPREPGGGARCLAWEVVGYGASIPEGRDRDISVARC